MRSLCGSRSRRQRRGASTVELAILLPFICFMFALAVDYARIFYFAVTLENCARNGAYYASNYPNANHIYSDIYGYKTMNEAIMSDAVNVSSMAATPDPTYQVQYGATEDGPWTSSETSTSQYVKVTVSWTFQSLTNFPPLPESVPMSRTVIMKMAPAIPVFVS